MAFFFLFTILFLVFLLCVNVSRIVDAAIGARLSSVRTTTTAAAAAAATTTTATTPSFFFLSVCACVCLSSPFWLVVSLLSFLWFLWKRPRRNHPLGKDPSLLNDSIPSNFIHLNHLNWRVKSRVFHCTWLLAWLNHRLSGNIHRR